MNDQANDQITDNERRIARLFEKVSRRVTLPDDQEQAVRQQLREQWIQVTGTRKQQRRLMWAAAASMLVVISMIVTLNRTPTGDMNGQYIAEIERRTGEIMVYDALDGSWETLPPGPTTLGAGQIIASGEDSRIALHWRAGGMLRIDENTEFRIASSTALELTAGRVYYDSLYELGGDQPYVNLMIQTPLGVVRHLGTRFMTSLLADSLTVSVRDGEVAISGDAGGSGPRVQELAMAGEQVTIGHDGSPRRNMIDPSSPEYGWLTDIALSYQLDGKTASEFLEWVSGESGYSIEYASEAARAAASSATLKGSIDLEPLEALVPVLLTTDVTAQIVDNTIFVGVR